MTEIRVYPEHNKVVVTHDLSECKDPVLEVVAEHKEWQDEGYAYYRMPLTEFMEQLRLKL